MSDTKISNLTALGTTPADGDELAIVDTSASETKKIDYSNLLNVELNNLTTAEIQQLENVDSVTISNTQWGILGSLTASASELNKLDGATVTTAEINILDGVTSTTAELNILDGVTSTTAELNYLDGASSNLTNLTDAEIGELENIGSVTITNTQWGYLGAMSAQPVETEEIQGDGTTGRVLRLINLKIEDGTNASTIKCTVTSLWNGDTISGTDNIDKDNTTGDFTLDSGGLTLTIEASGLTGNAVMAMGHTLRNQSGTAVNHNIRAGNNDISMNFYNDAGGSPEDITSLVDSGNLNIYILYLTDA